MRRKTLENAENTVQRRGPLAYKPLMDCPAGTPEITVN
jgi:hypothetical protein